MPSLAQLIQGVNKATYWSRDQEEVLAALDYAQSQVYLATVKELRDTILKFDDTTIAIVAGTDTYALPADFGELKQLSERSSNTLPWRPIWPADLNDRSYQRREQVDPLGWGPDSIYEYAGPYLDGAQAEAGTTVYNVKIAPMPQIALACQIAYIAQCTPIATAAANLLIPNEGRRAIEALAIAELLGRNSDAGAAGYLSRYQRDLDLFLTFMRDRQIQRPAPLEPYIGDFD